MISQLELNKSQILNGDALDILPQLPDNFFSLLLTDPPYCISRKSNYHTMGRQGVDFGEWDRDFDQLSWLNLAIPKLRPWASVVIWNDWKKLGDIAEYLETVLKLQIKTVLTWIKTNPNPANCKRRFLQGTEHAIWAVKPGPKKKGVSWTYNEGYHPGWFRHSVVTNSSHPTKKPDLIFEEFITKLTNPGDWVLDPFGGGGTTAYAAERLSRKHLSIELDEDYYKIAKEHWRKACV